MWKNLLVILVLSSCSHPPTEPALPAAALSPDVSHLEAGRILAVMEKVADWQLAHPAKHRKTDWTQGALYTGMMALDRISTGRKYRRAMVEMARSTRWKLGPRKSHADDHCVGQTYIELYQIHRDPKMIQPTMTVFNDLVRRPHQESLRWVNRIHNREWAWCDALFMSPPALAFLSTATGERKYLDLMNRLWWKTTEYLYDRDEHLYFRDSRYFDRREANGKKVFWSRGNGWVMAGLVRVLQNLPEKHVDRPRYLTLYREMAEKIASLQQGDGMWRSSLLDPESYPAKETSGTGFYCYALAWGVNRGILDRTKYLPVVERAWKSLTDAVHPGGKLGWVQRIAAMPGKVKFEDSDVYGVGAFLLAGSQMFQIALLAGAPTMKVTASNPLDRFRPDETISLRWQAVQHRLPGVQKDCIAVIDDLTGRRLLSQAVDSDGDGAVDELIFQARFQPYQTRAFLVKSLQDPVPMIRPSRVFARFVPERKDDFAWENDRIAFRMYGPALQKAGEVSSGVDVWVKRVRHPVINRWYEAGDYHKDHGEGLDGYKVGPSRGCGGLGIWHDEKLLTSGNFSGWRILAGGPIRVVFELTYEAWQCGDRKISEVKRITLDAGQNLNRFESRFEVAGEAGDLVCAVGIVKRKGGGSFVSERKAGWMSYWEPGTASGTTGCGVVFGPAFRVEQTDDQDHHLLLARLQAGQPLVYHAGAGWSESMDFGEEEDWLSCLRAVSARLRSPIEVVILP